MLNKLKLVVIYLAVLGHFSTHLFKQLYQQKTKTKKLKQKNIFSVLIILC